MEKHNSVVKKEITVGAGKRIRGNLSFFSSAVS